MTSGNETFAQVSSILYDFNGSPRKVSTTWHRNHLKYKQSCWKDIIVQEKYPSSSSPGFPKAQIKFDILFFPGLRKRDFDWPNGCEMQDDLWNEEEN